MKGQRNDNVIVVGDSFNNTLGLIRSIGEAGIKPLLILVGDDRMFVSKSRYVVKTIRVNTNDEAVQRLIALNETHRGAYLICSNDKAALAIDRHEQILSQWYHTPMQGKCIGNLFEKDAQCQLAEKCGVTVPRSISYKRGYTLPNNIEFPILIKPNDSNRGQKSDIHICKSKAELKNALEVQSACDAFIIQQFIEKEYEINLIGAANSHGVCIPGGVKKLRHYPPVYGPCSFGEFLPIGDLPVEIKPLIGFVKGTKYQGPFSIELLHSKGENYFMEMNFRHDGLAYTATAAGVNLLDFYVNQRVKPQGQIKRTIMMDVSIDPLHVRESRVPKKDWIKDFIRTDCQLNFNLRDPMPTVHHYLNKSRFR